MKKLFNAIALLSLLFLSSCADKPEIDKEERLILKETSFSEIKDWKNDDFLNSLAAFNKSCIAFNKKPADRELGKVANSGTYGDWQSICRKSKNLQYSQARRFFETHFVPFEARSNIKKEGLFTGYYEPELEGSYTKSEIYKYPLYKMPNDIVEVDLGLFKEDLKGKKISGKINGRKLIPYDTRADIESGSLNGRNLEIIWVKSDINAFFLQIQGSGRVVMDNGKTIRIGYAGQNGHSYYAIGRELIKNGEVAKEDMSLQAIRKWMEENPDKATDLMNLNKSYIFFQELKDNEILGAQNVPLTPNRSLAIDRNRIPYGVPIWLEADAPIKGDKDIKRLMIAQDTGGAISGAIRGDVFWGHGKQAELRAGHMKSKGIYYLLLPKSVVNK